MAVVTAVEVTVLQSWNMGLPLFMIYGNWDMTITCAVTKMYDLRL